MVGESGPEAIIPLNSQGASYMAGMYRAISREVMRESQTRGYATPTSGNVHNTVYNHTTNFRDITIQAQAMNPSGTHGLKRSEVRQTITRAGLRQRYG